MEAKSNIWTPVKRYECTIQNCENTDLETDILSISIPANTWLDDEMIEVFFATESLQNYGSNRNLTHKIYFGSVSATSTLLVSSSANVGKSIRSFKAVRNGSDLYINGRGGADQFYTTYTQFSTDYLTTGNGGAILSNCDFTQNQVLKISNQWQTASANIYIRMLWAYAVKARVK